jgi:hypothetical protein
MVVSLHAKTPTALAEVGVKMPCNGSFIKKSVFFIIWFLSVFTPILVFLHILPISQTENPTSF